MDFSTKKLIFHDASMLGGKGESSNATPCCDFEDFEVIFILTCSLLTHVSVFLLSSMHLPFSFRYMWLPCISTYFMALFRIKEKICISPFSHIRRTTSWITWRAGTTVNIMVSFRPVHWHMHWEMCLYLTPSTHPSLRALDSNMQFHWKFCRRVEISQEVYFCVSQK